MPDINKQTVSASQAAALFNKSPYQTRWTLYQSFVNGIEIDQDNERMEAGTYLEPGILKWTADRLRLEMVPNSDERYVRHREHPLGATIDASITRPDSTQIIVESKNVDFLIWRDQWTPERIPVHIEFQVQTQILVYDAPDAIVACLVGGNELLLYQREALPEVHSALVRESRSFMEQVRTRRPPDPFGVEIELKVLKALYPEPAPGKVVDLRGEPDDMLWAERIDDYRELQARRLACQKAEKALKVQLMNRLEDASAMVVPGLWLRRTSNNRLIAKEMS